MTLPFFLMQLRFVNFNVLSGRRAVRPRVAAIQPSAVMGAT
jgi:hypothetical protein